MTLGSLTSSGCNVSCGVASMVTGWDDLARCSAGSDAAGGIRALLFKPHRTQSGTVGRALLLLDAGGGGADWDGGGDGGAGADWFH